MARMPAGCAAFVARQLPCCVKINRLILWLALAGMVLAVHLWVQKARGFDQGCLGLAKPVAVVDGGCREVDALPASHLLRVSNAAWGFAFYFGVALLALAKIVVSPRWARGFHGMSEAAVVAGLVYSGYLVFTMVFVSHMVCALCLISAVLVFALFVLHVALRRQGGLPPIAETARGTELGFAAVGMFAAAGMLIGVLVFVNRLGTRPLDQGATREEVERLVGGALGIYIDGEKLAEMRACHFERQAPPLDLTKFIGPTTPFIGKSDGIPVVVFSDPNCEICKEYHAEFLRAAEKFGDRARFTVVPRVIWDESIVEAAALKIAEGSGKYFELWQALFNRPPEQDKGMTVAQITELFRHLGLDPTNLDQRLAAARPGVLADREQAKASGIDRVPSVYIAGRKVWSPNRGVKCLGNLIDQATAESVAPATTPPPRQHRR